MSLGTLFTDGPLCPFTHRVRIASAELDAPVDVICGDKIPADVREANNGGKWPIFVPAGGSEMLRESAEIVQHLIERSGARGVAYRSDRATLAQAGGHVTPFLYRLPLLEEIRGHAPAMLRENAALHTWVDRAVQRPSFRAVAPGLDELRRFYAERTS